MSNGQVPQLSPSVLMYHQVSMYAFNLAQWTTENGAEGYLQMLRTLAELCSYLSVDDREPLFAQPPPPTPPSPSPPPPASAARTQS